MCICMYVYVVVPQASEHSLHRSVMQQIQLPPGERAVSLFENSKYYDTTNDDQSRIPSCTIVTTGGEFSSVMLAMVCVFVCVCMCVCVCMYVYVYVCLCVHVYVCVCMCVYVYVYVYVFVCICIYVYVYVGVYNIYVYVYVLFVCVCVFVCMCMLSFPRRLSTVSIGR